MLKKKKPSKYMFARTVSHDIKNEIHLGASLFYPGFMVSCNF